MLIKLQNFVRLDFLNNQDIIAVSVNTMKYVRGKRVSIKLRRPRVRKSRCSKCRLMIIEGGRCCEAVRVLGFIYLIFSEVRHSFSKNHLGFHGN